MLHSHILLNRFKLKAKSLIVLATTLISCLTDTWVTMGDVPYKFDLKLNCNNFFLKLTNFTTNLLLRDLWKACPNRPICQNIKINGQYENGNYILTPDQAYISALSVTICDFTLSN